MHRPFSIFCALLLACAVTAPLRATDLQDKTRLKILSALLTEHGAVRVPLPAGPKGVFLATNGQIDREHLQHEITQNGTAFKTGMLVEITKIQFKSKEIVFEVDGGGKKGKWYNHIQVGGGMGGDDPGTDDPQTYPVNPNADQDDRPGSTITLLFPGKLPDLTPDDLKDYLAPVLDFDAAKNPKFAFSPAEVVPPQFQKAIEEKRAQVGMDEDMVRAAMGPPDRKVREDKEGAEQEDWIYETSSLKIIFVTFEGHKVVSVQEYHGGPRGETKDYPEEPPI